MHLKIIQNTIGMSTLVLLFGIAGMAQAQTAEDGLRLSQRAPASGARMIGVGTKGYGGFGDFTALNGNPAGLGLVQLSSLTGTVHSLRTSDASSSHTRGFSSSGISQNVSRTNLGSLAWLYRAPTSQGSLVFGLAFNQVASFDRELRFSGSSDESTITTSFLPFEGEYTLTDDGGLELDDFVFSAFNGGLFEFFPALLAEDSTGYPFLEAVIPGTTIDQHGRVKEHGRMNEASFGGSVEVGEGMFVGASVSLAFGRYELRSTFEEDDVLDLNTTLDYNVLQDDGSLLEGFNYLRYQQRVASDLLGVNLRLGVSKKVAPNVRVGIAVETPTRISIDESYGTTFETHFDDGGILTYGDQTGDVGNGAFSYRLRTPWRVNAGISLELEGFTLLADAQLVDWSQMRFNADNEGIFDDLNDQISDDYSAVVNFGAGAEVNVGKVLLRVGAALQPDPITLDLRDSSGDILKRDRLHISAGFGYHFSPNMLLNVGWTMGTFDAAYLPYPVDAYGPRQDASLHIDESVTRHQVVVGVTYAF